ncbi:cyclase family protein [Peptostreptococcus faecalis]|uniref:cyclase family protein n=1 Tax=Peptostreptococcus faecalis TaxID=2045015 RepID=UPI000C7AA4B2|nr:cyclase family protein [Peptostreptococcus faecalis]
MKDLWKVYNECMENSKWVDLSYKFDEETPHWSGFDKMEIETVFDFDTENYKAQKYNVITQYGTHIDAPCHFVPGKRSMDQIPLEEMVLPLCVIDKSDVVKENNDYALTVEDILEWEKEYGKIPEKAFVAFRSDWSKRDPETLDNLDEQGNKHYPGWKKEAVEFLIKERNITAIGHETSDTDAPEDQKEHGFAAEYYLLEQDKYQIELLRNLDQCPPVGSIIFCTFLNVTDGVGFSARCFALCPK